MPNPIVAIVGRPNVGKSTFFNRVAGLRQAVVEDEPGTTRDRLFAPAEWAGTQFTLVDTGGLDLVTTDNLSKSVQDQARQAIADADVVLFLVDASQGITAVDSEVSGILRSSGKPVLLLANKADNQKRDLEALQFYELALGDVYPVSGIHGHGVAEVLDKVVEMLPVAEPEAGGDAVRIAIVGRPNVGKSSLTNSLLGEERVIVDSKPGTTRDAIDVVVRQGELSAVLVDTAGIRRRGRVEVGVEKHSVMRALRAIDRSEVCILLIDAADGLTAQDAHVGGYIVDAGRGIVVVANKSDLLRGLDRNADELGKWIRAQMRFARHAPLLFISALTGSRVGQVLPAALAVAAERTKRVPTAQLNDVVQRAIASHSPPSKKGKQLRLYYTTQAESEPPTFVFFVNNPELVHFSYQRYLENSLRDAFGFQGVPLVMRFRASGKAEAR